MDAVANQITEEMESRAMDMQLSENDKRRYWELAHLPDEVFVECRISS